MLLKARNWYTVADTLEALKTTFLNLTWKYCSQRIRDFWIVTSKSMDGIFENGTAPLDGSARPEKE